MNISLRGGCSALVVCTLLAASAPAVVAAETNYPKTALIMDASGSMWAPDASGTTTRMEAARQAAIQVVDGLPAEQELALLTYGTGTGNSDAEKAAGCEDVKTLVPLGGSKQEVTNQLSGLVASGYTPIGKSLLEAEKEVAGSGPSHVVLISDGIDTCSPPPVTDIAREIRDRNPDLTIDVVGLDVDAETRAQLQGIADAGGGTYSDAGDAKSLVEKLTAGGKPAMDSGDTSAAESDKAESDKTEKATETPSESATESETDSESAQPSESEAASESTAESDSAAASETEMETTVTPSTISGAASAADAPALGLGGINNGKAQPQVYNDNLPATIEAGAATPADKELHWSVDLKEGQQLSAAFLVPGAAEAGADGTSMTITPKLTNSDGKTCVANSTDISAEGNYGAPQSASILSEVISAKGNCKPGTYDLSLTRAGNLVGEQELPVELSAWVVPEIDEEKLAAASDKPAITDVTIGEATGALPTGNSADNAPAVETGTYDLEIAPGETKWFKVPVEEGQRLQAQLEAAAAGMEGHKLEWKVFGPQFHPVQVDSSEVELNAAEPTTAGIATQPIRWLNLREKDATANGFLAGQQLVAVQHKAPAGATAPVNAKVALTAAGSPETAPNFSAANAAKKATNSTSSAAWLWWLVFILLLVGLFLLARWYRDQKTV